MTGRARAADVKMKGGVMTLRGTGNGDANAVPPGHGDAHGVTSANGDAHAVAHGPDDGPSAQVAEAVAIVDAARRKDIALRLLGGVAIYLHSGPRHGVSPWRVFGDLDFIGRHADVKKINEVFTGLGYDADHEVNTLHGRYRLLFAKPGSGQRIDVLLDVFQMCHRLPLVERLGVDSPTISLADLLLTKLQIRELNRKDADDIAFLLSVHPIADHDDEAVNGAYVARLCSHDWGLYRTTSDNLARLADFDAPADVDRDVLRSRVHALQQRIDDAPKSAKWRLRAKVGTRYPWYEEVEELDR